MRYVELLRNPELFVEEGRRFKTLDLKVNSPKLGHDKAVIADRVITIKPNGEVKVYRIHGVEVGVANIQEVYQKFKDDTHASETYWNYELEDKAGKPVGYDSFDLEEVDEPVPALRKMNRSGLVTFSTGANEQVGDSYPFIDSTGDAVYVPSAHTYRAPKRTVPAEEKGYFCNLCAKEFPDPMTRPPYCDVCNFKIRYIPRSEASRIQSSFLSRSTAIQNALANSQ